MQAMTSKYRVLETNVLLERFLTYREVFTEYFKTVKVIERGEALRYETYSRLTDNYISNIHRFMKLCDSYITKYNLRGSLVEGSLDKYFVNLIEALNCLDCEQDVVDHSSLEQSKDKIAISEKEFVKTISFLAK